MADEQHSSAILISYIRRAHTMMDEIRDIQADITDMLKEAKSAGFDATKIREVERWLHKIEKHGREKMDEAEAIYDLYRSVYDGQAVKLDEMMDTARDRALVAQFAGGDSDEVGKQLSVARKKMNNAVAMARAAKQARNN